MRFKYLHISFIKNLVKKRPVLSIFSLVVVLSVILTLFRLELFKLISLPVQRTNKVTLTFALDDQKRVFKGEVTEDMTILDALNLSAAAGSIKFQYSIQNNGQVRIMAIDGHLISGSFGKLSIFLNSQPIKPSDINKITIDAGDKVEIRAIK